MYNCLIIFGESNSGKTYSADLTNKKFNIKTIHFDFVISLVSESIRKYFEKTKFEEEEMMRYCRGLGVSISEFEMLVNDLKKMFSNNFEFFENFYVKSIKGIRPSWSFRLGIDELKDVMNLGRNGQLLDPYGLHIMDLVFKYLIKETNDFIIEGVYFSKKSFFLEFIQLKCEKISYLETFYNQETKEYSYNYNTKMMNSLDEICKNLKDELNFGNL